MKKKMKLKNKQKQKQKQKQSVVVNIDNSRKTISRKKQQDEKQQQQQKAPSVIPQPIYIPQYAPQPFRQEPTNNPPVFNPNPPVYNSPPLVPQQINPTIVSSLSTIASSSSSFDRNNNSIPSYVTFAKIVSDDDSVSVMSNNPPENFMTARRPENEERNFNFMNETPSERRKVFIPQPASLPPQTLVTAKKYLDDKLIYNDRNIDNTSSPFSEEEYKIPSALDKEIRPLNRKTPKLPSPFNDVGENMVVDVAAPEENSMIANYNENEKRPRMRPVLKSGDRCAAITKSGEQCRNRRQFNSQFCGTHLRTLPTNEVLMRSDSKIYPMDF